MLCFDDLNRQTNNAKTNLLFTVFCVNYNKKINNQINYNFEFIKLKFAAILLTKQYNKINLITVISCDFIKLTE